MARASNGEPNYGMLAQRFLSARQWDRSLTTALEWLARNPENVSAHRIAAQSLVNLERTEEAKPHIEKVLAQNPDDGFAHRLIAIVQFKEGKFRTAYESIHRAIALNPNDAFHWYKLAHMSQLQGDFATAKQAIERARELKPDDASILNLAVLCDPKGAVSDRIRRFEEALALNPESAVIHNNIGAEYLNHLKDYAKAEEAFRRALSLDPSSKVYRQNLFIAVKKRDLIYRILCAPRDFEIKIIKFFGELRKKNLLLYILLIPLWLLAFRFVIVGLILWFALIWPLAKVYEYLTIGDLRARAGELGVRRGGFLGYRKWPLKVRLSIFAAILVLFWGSLAWLCLKTKPLSSDDGSQVILGTLLFLGVFGYLGYCLWSILKRKITAQSARKNARRLGNIFETKRRDEA